MSRQPVDARNAAETIALRALAFLASDSERLGRFLALTGIGPDELRTKAREPRMLAGVLDHLMGDETLLLVFATDTGLKPEAIASAYFILAGPPLSKAFNQRPERTGSGNPINLAGHGSQPLSKAPTMPFAPQIDGYPAPHEPTIGIDLGGTKIEVIVLDHQGRTLVKRRVAAPFEDYDATLRTLTALVDAIEQEANLVSPAFVGMGMPGSISPSSGLVQNANSTWLNGRPLATDLAAALARPLRVANDANCFALSEGEDGAGKDANMLFGVILGTGCGGGLVHAGRLINGPRGIGGEWGHNPLPWPEASETPGPTCWCGRIGCLETWISGPGLAADHARAGNQQITAEEIVALATIGGTSPQAQAARATLQRHASRLARGLAHVVNLLDPDVIVLGGGLSNLTHLYDDVPRLIAPHIFADDRNVAIRPPAYGDASGARGAARLWRQPAPP